ncbi:MAG TPA: CpsD/CapB family tyrosine-protein kinase [Candidatus Sulfotelmatobacter sp.]|nr:CpsD/CapB family tyrosine-protein kinase [Candidatus Sulfotelmatobacter sp.]
MSHIFDALQKSVAEQADIDIPSAAVATELLEATERKTAAVRAKTAVLDPPASDDETIVLTALRSALDSTPVIPISARPALVAEEAPLKTAAVDQFSQFQTLRTLIPPQSRIVCVTEKESLPAEKFRFVAVRLRQLQQVRPLKRLVLTSTLPQEGKSTAAANLACALARRSQQRTLLLDGDLRRPSLARLFGLGKIPGISDWLQGECSPANSIYHLEEAGLWVLPAGNIPRNPLELMQSGKLSNLMDQLTSWFDWIVIDTPPVLPLADTSIWTRLADGVLLIARQGTTEREQLKRGLEAIESSKLLGALLNSCTNTKKTDYYYQPVIES